MNTTTRLFIVVILVGLLATSTYVLPESLKPKNIQLPEWKLDDMPLQFDSSWQGAEVEVDPEIRKRLLQDAVSVADRAYQDEQSNVVSLHTALFSDLDAGVRHSPINCYRGAGWREIDRERATLVVPSGGNVSVSLTTWEREGDRVLVMYWYQLGEHTLFDGWDLWMAKWDMRGREQWPPMVKVLLQTQATDMEKAEERIRTIAGNAYEWVNGSHSDDPVSRPPAG